MNFASLKSATPRFSRSAVALALVAFGASASAVELPEFTVDGDFLSKLSQPSFVADNILISDFAVVRTSGNTFTEQGYLSVTGFQNNDQLVSGTSLGSEYNMYLAFTGTGTLSPTGNANVTFGSFQTLTYQLFGYDGPSATFTVTQAGATENATGEVLLASGGIGPGIPGTGGSVSTITVPGGISPTASVLASFNLTDAGRSVFIAPTPFYNMAFASFTNTPTQVMMFDGGFTIEQGGGTINFVAMAPIPEPETYALMLAGLAAVGFVARRRRPQA